MAIISLAPHNTYVDDWSLEQMEYQDGTKVSNPFELTPESESRGAANHNFESQSTWFSARLLVLEAQQAIVRDTFDFKGKSLVEFGCGAMGWFYNFILPKRKNWLQFDVNPKIVKSNKKVSRSLFRFPRVKVGNMYEMPLADESVDVVFGLSSWDSIYFLDKSADEVKRVLKQGGHFVHLQDISPADGPYLLMEAKKRKDCGMDTTFPVRYINEMGFHYVFGIDSIDWGEVRLAEYLNKELESVFQERDFKIEQCGGIEREILLDSEPFRTRFETMTGFPVSKYANSFAFAYGKFKDANDIQLANDQVKQWAYMDVFVAQKT